MTMFYLPIFPLGVLISIIGFILVYFLEKYNFTHHYKRPEMLNEKLGEIHFNFFIFVLIFYSIGNYVFMDGLLESDYWKIVNISLFCTLAIIPYTKPITYYFNSSNNFNIPSQTFSDIYFSFYNDYQRQNPFTKKEGLYFYITELKNKGYISNYLYDIMAKNIEKINIMSVYYNASLKRNLRESRILLNKANKKINWQNLRYSLKQMISEKENKIKALNESIKMKKSEIDYKSDEESEKNGNYLNNIDNKSNEYIKTNSENKINNDENIFSSNNNIKNNNNNPSSDYKIPLLVNIGVEIDELAKLDISEDDNKNENENFNDIKHKIEEENISDENGV